MSPTSLCKSSFSTSPAILVATVFGTHIYLCISAYLTLQVGLGSPAGLRPLRVCWTGLEWATGKTCLFIKTVMVLSFTSGKSFGFAIRALDNWMKIHKKAVVVERAVSVFALPISKAFFWFTGILCTFVVCTMVDTVFANYLVLSPA